MLNKQPRLTTLTVSEAEVLNRKVANLQEQLLELSKTVFKLESQLRNIPV